MDEDAAAPVDDAAGGLPGDAAEPVAGAGAAEGGGRESGGSQVVSAATSIAAAGVALQFDQFGCILRRLPQVRRPVFDGLTECCPDFLVRHASHQAFVQVLVATW